MLLDAEEEDNDEIEIIYESPANRQAARQPSAANGQEPPEFHEPEPVKEEPKPLSKQQQEEAAKLAERRKRFDNQRYQQPVPQGQYTQPPLAEQRSPLAQRSELPVELQGSAFKNGYPGPTDRADLGNSWKNNKPSTDMMLGLNKSEVVREEPLDQYCGLPGGIFDDFDDQPAPKAKMHHRHQHDDVKSSGFDDDDEKLMKEILENFDDI
jgi:hypothetical protein